MKRFPVLGLFCLTLVISLSGCFMAAKRGLKEIRGASGDFVPVQEVSKNGFAKYKDVRLGAIHNDIGKVCPGGVITRMKAGFVKMRRDLEDEYPGGSPALHVDLTITYLQNAGGAKAILGGLGFMVVRAKFSDDGGKAVSDTLLVGESEAMRVGEDELADAVIKALRDYLKEYKKD